MIKLRREWRKKIDSFKNSHFINNKMMINQILIYRLSYKVRLLLFIIKRISKLVLWKAPLIKKMTSSLILMSRFHHHGLTFKINVLTMKNMIHLIDDFSFLFTSILILFIYFYFIFHFIVFYFILINSLFKYPFII